MLARSNKQKLPASPLPVVSFSLAGDKSETARSVETDTRRSAA